ncbi:MAG: hypothetical protein WA252_19380 [Candidatus Sulfotelmatobacter sp.]
MPQDSQAASRFERAGATLSLDHLLDPEVLANPLQKPIEYHA